MAYCASARRVPFCPSHTCALLSGSVDVSCALNTTLRSLSALVIPPSHSCLRQATSPKQGSPSLLTEITLPGYLASAFSLLVLIGEYSLIIVHKV